MESVQIIQTLTASANVMELPPAPDDVCARCWEGVIAARFGLWSEPVQEVRGVSGNREWTGGYQYTMSEAEFNACKDSVCCWGEFIDREVFCSLGQYSPPWHFRVGTLTALTSKGALEIVIVVNAHQHDVYEISAHIDDPAAAWIDGRTRNPIVKRPDVLALARSLIEECAQTHERCQTFSDLIGSASLPSRLIDCSDPLNPHIVETKGLEPHVRYVALSYVWGEDQPHRTTAVNLPGYLTHIELSQLPQTILDAVHVTYTVLGIRYLWVDSLCIIQDSREDKHRELAKMRDVYLHASLTIDAGNAKGVSQGFLHDGKPLRHGIPFLCPQRLGEVPEIGSVHISLPWDPQAVNPRDFVRKSSPHISTANRAWCLQEALTSGRRLLFTDLDLQYWCRTAVQHVGGPVRSLKLESQASKLPEVVFRQPFSSILPVSSDWDSVHHAWRMLVEDYTCRFLSHPSDRLVACSGVAQLFGNALRSDYLAGLWKDSLLYDLLWRKTGWTVQGGDNAAPSWSWAVSNISVAYWLGDHEYGQQRTGEELAEVGECAVVLEDLVMPFGRVLSGFVTLHAPLLGPYRTSCGYHWPNGTYEPGTILHPTVISRIRKGDNNINIVAGDGMLSCCPDWGQIWPCMDRDHPSEEALRDLWLVPLLYRPESGGYAEFLVVTAVGSDIEVGSTSAGRGRVFRRIGYWNECRYQARRNEDTERVIGKLREKVNGQWTFPRTEIKLV